MLWLVTALGYLFVGVCVILIPILMYIVCHFAKLLSGLLWYVKIHYGEDFSIDDIDEFVKEKRPQRERMINFPTVCLKNLTGGMNMKLKAEPVKAKMRSYGMSGKQLSFETDIGVNTLYRLLKGGKCSTKAAARIAVVLRLPLNSIIEA